MKFVPKTYLNKMAQLDKRYEMTLKSDKEKLLRLIHDVPEMRAKEGKCENCGAQWWLVRNKQGVENKMCPVCGSRIMK